MVFDDKVNREAIERYMATQRPYASYLPDPVEFIARSNGLDSKRQILDKLLGTRILVVGVGFWSGTPIGIPLDPRARLVVPKFNPSRTFSPAGGLGIGGCFFSCDPIVSHFVLINPPGSLLQKKPKSHLGAEAVGLRRRLACRLDDSARLTRASNK